MLCRRDDQIPLGVAIFLQTCLILLLAQTSKFSSIFYTTKYSDLRTIYFHVSNGCIWKTLNYWSTYYFLLHKNLHQTATEACRRDCVQWFEGVSEPFPFSLIHIPSCLGVESKKHLACSRIIIPLFHKGVQTTKVKHWNQRINKENGNRWEIQNVDNKNMKKTKIPDSSSIAPSSKSSCFNNLRWLSRLVLLHQFNKRQIFATQKYYTSSRRSRPCLPLSAVFVAQLAHFLLVCVFPHQAVVLSQYALGATGHAEQSILEVGTLRTVSRTLKVKKK